MSNPATRYVVDTNVLLEAYKRYYAFDLCPGFWDSLLHHHASGRVCSIDRVKVKLVGNNDLLSDWVRNSIPATMFADCSVASIASVYGQIATWVQSQVQFTNAAKAQFAAIADSWLIAYAKANDMTLVTHELLQPAAKSRVPIPNVCQQFSVKVVDTYAMLRDLAVSFVWSK